MVRSVFWSPKAVADLDAVIIYVEKHWGKKATNRFIDHLEETIALLKAFPEQFPLLNADHGIRKCVLTKQNVIYYRLKKEKIEILRLYDVRQDPQNVQFF